ncbi:hypothetical protein [Pseudobacillus badius]|uniref:hypothetical protein n=1 Tax=Bacillus badius TaxID=1455 RepID=UPI0007BB893A|nr:hypothetical protein [Bacillus badius]KZR57519.1 hypothetical protein A3781_19700 [Bacillus badius]
MENIQWYKDRQVPVGTKVKAYYNLHKKLYSFVAMAGGYRGKVVGHSPSLLLSEVEFVVNQSGRKRVLREQRKNVHAYVVGALCESVTSEEVKQYEECINYSPYDRDHFYLVSSGKRIDKAKAVLLADKKVWVA